MSFIPTTKPTGMLIPQPYPTADFSGGWTENFIQNQNNRFMRGDNFVLNIDRKLQTRYGSAIIDSTNYLLPSGNQRVGAMINFDNDTAIMAQSGPYLYVLNPNWQALTGPQGNPPLAPATADSQISYGLFQHKMYITNDSSDSKVSMVYIDQNGLYQVRTAGLPALPKTPNYTDAQLLSVCITAANDLKSKFNAHIQDAVLHGVATGIVTAADATDLPSLLTLCANMYTIYGFHIFDANLGKDRSFHIPWERVYGVHYVLDLTLASCLNIDLSVGQPVDLPSAASFLDDFLSKYKWHIYAPYTHDANNNCAVIGVHLPSTQHINYSVLGVSVAPNYTTVFTVINQFIQKFNSHLATTNIHVQSDTQDLISCPAPVDYDSLVVAIAHSRAQYNSHQTDSLFPRAWFNGIITAGGSYVSSLVQQYSSDNSNPFNFDTGMLAYSVPDSNFNPGVGHPNGITYVTISGYVPGSNFQFTNPQVATAAVSTGPTTGNAYIVSRSLYHIWLETNPTATQIVPATLLINGSDLQSWVSILSDLVGRYNAHDSSVSAHSVPQNQPFPDPLTVPLPNYNSIGVTQVTYQVPTIAQYVYAFHYFYEYMAGSLIFDTVGPVTLVGPIETPLIGQTDQFSFNAASIQGVTITNIPTLPYSSSSDNYDLTNIKVNIYRTTNSGAALFLVTELPNGTPTYIDTMGDTVGTTPGGEILVNQSEIYTSGGVVNFDPAPMCKYLHILNGTALFGGIWDSGQFFPNRVRQSIANAPDSSPGSFFDDLDDVITGISSARSNWVVFCQNSTYRLSGAFNDLGQGALTHDRISDSIGCLSNSSIVQTEVGVFFAGNDGFYYTDSYQLVKLSSELNRTYQSRIVNTIQQKRIYGTYDKWNHRIWWSIQKNPYDVDVSESWVCDLNFGVSAQGVFTTASGDYNYMPSSMLFFKNTQYRADSRGYFFVHAPIHKSDPIVDTTTPATAWNTTNINWEYASCAIDFGSTFNRKWVPRVSLAGKNVGNVAIDIFSINDNGKSEAHTAPMYYKQNPRWGDALVSWGQSTYLWDQVKQPDMWRRFPAGQMRCDFKQIVLTPARIGVYRYEDWPLDAFANSAGGATTATLTINSPSGYTNITWPSDCTGYTIAFALDNYTAEYPILSVGNPATSLVIGNGVNAQVPPLANQSWVIRGILKDGALSLTSINLHYALMGKMQDAYHGPSDSGENT